MPKIDIAKATVRRRGRYPDPWGAVTEGREKNALGDVAGLTQFGVNLTRLKPGAASALRHWHETEDEFIYVLQGEIMLIEDGGTTVLLPGDAAGFQAGVPNGHHLATKSTWLRSKRATISSRGSRRAASLGRSSASAPSTRSSCSGWRGFSRFLTRTAVASAPCWKVCNICSVGSRLSRQAILSVYST